MKISVVASGSKGNLTYVKTEDASIIIDAGISKKRLVDFLEKNNIDNSFDAIFITHEHIDHISGLLGISKYLNCPIYMTSGTKIGIERKYPNIFESRIVNVITNQSVFYINGTKITAIPTFHDATDSNGYQIESNDDKLVYITDTGYIHTSLLEKISNASIYVMETNHDPDLLLSCEKRPYSLRMRILGDHGHMSNKDALYNLCHIIGDKTKLVFYAHISEDCNIPEIIKQESKQMFDEMGMDVSNIEFVYTSQIPTEVYEV